MRSADDIDARIAAQYDAAATPTLFKGMNRRNRLRALCTPKGMRTAALTQRQRRGAADHRFVLGGLRMVQSRIELRGVEMGPAWNIIRPIALTSDVDRFYRWRTRQAATQFMHRWALADLHVFDLGWADVLPARLSHDKLEGPLS